MSDEIINTREKACNPKIPAIAEDTIYTLQIVSDFYEYVYQKQWDGNDFDKYLNKIIKNFVSAQESGMY